MAWDDAKKDLVIEAYQNADPTPETSVEIVKEIAEDHDESPNGVRMILTKAGVYIKKTSGVTSNGNGTPRVSKAQAQEELTAALTSVGQIADEDIISKLTGKAAKYFAGVITAIDDIYRSQVP